MPGTRFMLGPSVRYGLVIARRRSRRSNLDSLFLCLDCCAEPVIGTRFAQTRWLAMKQRWIRRSRRRVARRLRTADQYPGDEHQHAAEHDLKPRPQKRRV